MKIGVQNRRQFVRQIVASVGAVGLPLPIVSSAWGGGSSAPNSKITIGCIGVGGMGTGNMKVFLGLDPCRVVAVCDTYEGRRHAAKETVDTHYGDHGCRMYGDYRELLARKDIDAVMIAVQDHSHALVATAAAKAGKDMYCEKPLGVSVEQCRRIRDAVRQAKRVFQTGTWQRSDRKFQQACELVAQRLLGKDPHGRSVRSLPRVSPRLPWVPRARNRCRPALTGRCGGDRRLRSPTIRAALHGPIGI